MNNRNGRSKKPFVIAVTGGIASGKTTVCELFGSLFNIETIDADELAKEAVAAGSECLGQIVSVFGSEILDSTNNLNRPLMKKIVFQDQTLRKELEQIVHPAVKTLILQNLMSISGEYCLIGIPLLKAKNQDPNIDRILVVDCEEQEQIKRAMARDNLSQHDVENILSSQLGRKERLDLADDVILNKGSKFELAAEVERLNSLYEDLSSTI